MHNIIDAITKRIMQASITKFDIWQGSINSHSLSGMAIYSAM